ncbi:MAG: FecR domain-containing protein, partial [Treponemataceae bacterium]
MSETRITMKILSFIAILSVLTVTFAAASPKAESNSAAKPARPVVARIVFVEGSVTVDGVEAEIGMELGLKASFKTAPGASCDIVYNEKNAIRVGMNTIATIDFSKAVTEISIDKGGMTSVLRKLEKVSGDDSFRVRTKGATAGVRGTSFCVWANADGSYICACNGEVHTIDSKGGNEFTLKAAHHV